MRNTLVGTTLAALLLLGATACSDDEKTDPDAKSSATPGTEDTTDATDDADTESQSPETAVVPITSKITLTTDTPAVALPIINEWTTPEELTSGVFQTGTRDGETLLTAYQTVAEPAQGDEAGAKAWLENYADNLSKSDIVKEMDDAEYGIDIIDSTLGGVEVVSQHLTYTNDKGITYESYYVAREVGGYLLAVQYAAPEGDFSMDTWEKIKEAGLEFSL